MEEGEVKAEEPPMFAMLRRFIMQFEEMAAVADVIDSSLVGNLVRGVSVAEPDLLGIPATPLGSSATSEIRSLNHTHPSPCSQSHGQAFRFVVSRASPTVLTDVGGPCSAIVVTSATSAVMSSSTHATMAGPKVFVSIGVANVPPLLLH